MDTWIIILAAILLGVGLIVLIAVLLKKSKARKENELQAMRKLQDEALKSALSNPFIKNAPTNEGATPFKVKYRAEVQDAEGGHMPVIRIDEISRASEKKYMFGYHETISIGRQYGTCKIMSDRDNAELICMIFYTPNGFGIQLKADFMVNLIRGHQSLMLSSDVIRLESGDRIRAGGTDFHISINY